jgi:hypothetical protein
MLILRSIFLERQWIEKNFVPYAIGKWGDIGASKLPNGGGAIATNINLCKGFLELGKGFPQVNAGRSRSGKICKT